MSILGTELVIDMDLRVTGLIAERIAAAAEKRDQKPGEIMAALIEAIVRDDLFDVVLGDVR
jgi:hypothetical protein